MYIPLVSQLFNFCFPLVSHLFPRVFSFVSRLSPSLSCACGSFIWLPVVLHFFCMYPSFASPLSSIVFQFCARYSWVFWPYALFLESSLLFGCKAGVNNGVSCVSRHLTWLKKLHFRKPLVRNLLRNCRTCLWHIFGILRVTEVLCKILDSWGYLGRSCNSKACDACARPIVGHSWGIVEGALQNKICWTGGSRAFLEGDQIQRISWSILSKQFRATWNAITDLQHFLNPGISAWLVTMQQCMLIHDDVQIMPLLEWSWPVTLSPLSAGQRTVANHCDGSL